MLNIRFTDIANLTYQALSSEGVLGKHLIPLFNDIEKGGIQYIYPAFENYVPIRRSDDADEFQRARDRLSDDFRSFVDSKIATREMLDSPLSADEVICLLGDALNAHDEDVSMLDTDTYNKYAAMYDLLTRDLEIPLLVVYFAYQKRGRNLCAYRCYQEMEEQSRRFVRFMNLANQFKDE